MNVLARRLTRPLRKLEVLIGVQQALARAAAGAARRTVDPGNAETWEFSGFSQNGEDGILDVLIHCLAKRERTFVEIGASNGLQNNSSYRAIVARESGVMLDGNAGDVAMCQYMLRKHTMGVTARQCFVSHENIVAEAASWPSPHPDLFSLDIDGQDYWVMQALLDSGFRPSIIAVEYNSAFGPTRQVTIPRDPDFYYLKASPTGLYYGVSLAGWQSLLGSAGYRCVATDSNGVNAFFVLPERVRPEALAQLPTEPVFRENFFQLSRWRGGHAEQYSLITGMPLVSL